MSNTYQFNVLTIDGAALIAQATAANPIVYVSALSKATAAASAAELATAPASWYTGKAGELVAVSATGNVAEIRAVWRNSGQAQAAKSVAITARLASQSDAQAVVITAMSDPDSTIVLPGSTDTGAGVAIPFYVQIGATGSVEVTPGACASIADLARFMSIHAAGNPNAGDAQTVRGEKTFKNFATFDGGLLVNNGEAAIIDTADGSYLSFEEDRSKFGYLGYELNGGGLVITGRESGANNCESIIFGYTSDLSDNPNDPSYFLKMLTNFNNSAESAIQVHANRVVPASDADANKHDLGTSDRKWRRLYANAAYIYSDLKFGSNASTAAVEWDGESVDVRVYGDLYLEFEGADQAIYCNHTFMPLWDTNVDLGDSSQPWNAIYGRTFSARSKSGTVTRELQVWNGHYIDGYYSDTSQSISDEGIRLDFDYDTNLGKPSLWILDIDAGDPIIGLTSYEVDFQVPANVRTGIKMPYPGADGELKLGCPCVLKATNAAQTAIKMGDVLARDSSGWNVIRNNSTIAGVALYTCDFSGGNESFVNPLNYNAVCRLIALSSAASGAPFLAMMAER